MEFLSAYSIIPHLYPHQTTICRIERAAIPAEIKTLQNRKNKMAEGTRRGPYGKRHYTKASSSDGDSHENVMLKLRKSLLERREVDQQPNQDATDSGINQRLSTEPAMALVSKQV